MGKVDGPRHGSMAYWPRVRAKKQYARIRGWSNKKTEQPSILAFAGYKVGMTHIIATDNYKPSPSKGEDISIPVTIIECPPIKLFSIRFYKKNAYGLIVEKDFLIKNNSKELLRKVDLPKAFPELKELDNINPDEYADITALVYTQPKLSGLGKKKPEVFEVKLSGNNKEKLEFVKSHADKDIIVSEIFKEEQLLDAHAVTTGRGTQGPVKRFGIALKSHKSEKGRRQPGSRGPWKGQQHVMYRTAYSGQTGYHQRVQYNLQLLKIGDKPEDVNPKDGFSRYGEVKTTYLLIKGSIPGPKKRIIILTQPLRPMKNIRTLPTITKINTSSKQGR